MERLLFINDGEVSCWACTAPGYLYTWNYLNHISSSILFLHNQIKNLSCVIIRASGMLYSWRQTPAASYPDFLYSIALIQVVLMVTKWKSNCLSAAKLDLPPRGVSSPENSLSVIFIWENLAQFYTYLISSWASWSTVLFCSIDLERGEAKIFRVCLGKFWSALF